MASMSDASGGAGRLVRRFFEGAREGLILFEPERLRVLRVNATAAGLLGLAPDERAGPRTLDTLFEGLDPDDLARFADVGRDGGSFVAGPGVCVRRGGERLLPVRLCGGRARGGRSSLGLAAVRVEAGGDPPRPFFSLSEEMCGVVGLDGCFVRVNPAWEAVMGYRPEDLVGRPLETWVAPQDCPRVRRALGRLSQGGPVEFEARFRHRDGTARRLAWRAAFDGGTVNVAARERPGAWEGSAAARAAFFANVSHEVRTPMTAILGHADLALELCRRGPADPACVEHLRALRRHGEDFLGLIGDLIELARAESGDPQAVAAVRPLAARPEAGSAAPTPVRLDARVLLAEDNRETQRVVSIRLGLAGADVTLAANGRVAVDLAREARDAGSPFDLVLMDMQMPELDGYAATRELRDAGFDVPVVAVTAYALSEDRQECLRFGCDEYVTKPIHWDPLLALLSRLLEESRAVATR